MTYDFTTRVDRKNTGACKWDNVPESIKEKGYIPMTVADMEFITAPEITGAIIDAAECGILGYTQADEAYINSVIEFYNRHHGYLPSPKSVVCTGGVVPAIGIAIRAFTKPGDAILIQPPVYHPFRAAIIANGRTLIENPLRRTQGNTFEMDFHDLEQKILLHKPSLMILCSPHNPVGRVWTSAELIRVHELTAKYGVTVICDEIHSDIVYDRKNISYFNIGNAKENSIVCTAVSKTFNLAGLMCSNILIEDDKLRRLFANEVSVSGSWCIPCMARHATIAAYTRCDEWINQLISTLKENFALTYDFIDNYLPMIKYTKAEGTYLLWADFSVFGLSEESLNKFLVDNAGLLVSPGEEFGTGGEGFVRINLALPKRELYSALIRLYGAIKKRFL